LFKVFSVDIFNPLPSWPENTANSHNDTCGRCA
jgi:hypothetical protein